MPRFCSTIYLDDIVLIRQAIHETPHLSPSKTDCKNRMLDGRSPMVTEFKLILSESRLFFESAALNCDLVAQMPQPSHKFAFGLFTHLIVCKQKDAHGIGTERVDKYWTETNPTSICTRIIRSEGQRY